MNKEIFQEDAKSSFAKSHASFFKTASLLERQIKEALKPFNFTHSQLNVLSLLVRNHPEPMDAKTLKSKLVVSSPDLTRLIDRMVKKGVVARKTCDTNRRKIDITATEEGITTYFEIRKHAQKASFNFFEDKISNEEAELLRRILNKIRS